MSKNFKTRHLIESMATLGIDSAEALTKDLIKSRYRAAARKYHPDVSDNPDAKEIFLRVQSAYNQLAYYIEINGSKPIPKSIISPEDFFRLVGQSDLAELTGGVLTEIKLGRAAKVAAELAAQNLKSGGSGGAMDFVDGRLTQKLVFWARAGSQKDVFNRFGHFKSDSIKNLLRVAAAYEASDATTELDDDAYGIEDGNAGMNSRIATLIREFVNGEYVKVGREWVHKETLTHVSIDEIVATAHGAFVKKNLLNDFIEMVTDADSHTDENLYEKIQRIIDAGSVHIEGKAKHMLHLLQGIRLQTQALEKALQRADGSLDVDEFLEKNQQQRRRVISRYPDLQFLSEFLLGSARKIDKEREDLRALGCKYDVETLRAKGAQLQELRQLVAARFAAR